MIEPLHSGDGSTKKEQRVKTSLPKGRTLFLLITSFFLIIESACRTQSLKKPEFSEAQTGRAWQDYIRIDSSAKANAVSDTIVPLKIGEESASENSGLQADWWKIFNSSALTNLEEKALANNLNLKLAALRIQENRANATVLRANLYPSVYFDPSYTKQKFSAYRPNQFGNGSLPEITLSTYSMPFDVSYEIDVWGKFRYGLLANEATIRASQMERSVIQLSLTADVATNYLTVINLNRRLRIYNRTLDSRRQGLAINQQLYKAGLITQQDVTQAEIELASVEATITDLRRNSSTAQNNLAELCNLPFNNFLIDTAASDVDLPKIPLSVPSKLLNRRPDVAQYWALLQGAESQQEVAKAAYLPAVKLNGQLGYLAGTPEKVLQHNSLIWTISAGLSIPVFTGGRNAGAVAATDARSQQARVVYEQVIRRAGHEVQEALNQLQRRAEQVSILQRALASARTNAALAREQFRKGLSNYLNVVIADRSALDAENNLLLAQGEQLVQTVMLVKAAGGGWDGE